MRLDALVISIADADGRVVGINEAQCALLQRDKSSIIGHLWSEWTPPDDFKRLQLIFEKCLAGNPISTKRYVVGERGLKTTVLTQVFPLDFRDKRNVIAISQPLAVSEVQLNKRALAVLDYTIGIADELSRMARESGLVQLSRLLDEAKLEAERLAAMGGKPMRVPH